MSSDKRTSYWRSRKANWISYVEKTIYATIYIIWKHFDTLSLYSSNDENTNGRISSIIANNARLVILSIKVDDYVQVAGIKKEQIILKGSKWDKKPERNGTRYINQENLVKNGKKCDQNLLDSTKKHTEKNGIWKIEMLSYFWENE